MARAASLRQRRPPPYDAVISPKLGNRKDGGTYVLRYRDREHVNESGHGGLPVGVVPAAVCQGVTCGL